MQDEHTFFASDLALRDACSVFYIHTYIIHAHALAVRVWYRVDNRAKLLPWPKKQRCWVANRSPGSITNAAQVVACVSSVYTAYTGVHSVYHVPCMGK